MTPIQQMLLGVGASKKTYVDDVFSTYLYKENNSTQTINNGLDLAGEGGLVWIKNRIWASTHALYDTERGVNKRLATQENWSESTTADSVTSFNSNGYSIGNNEYINGNANRGISSWSFRKAPGFFDIVTYTQSGSDGSARTIDHNLGSVPGLIILKQTTGTENWVVLHRDLATNSTLTLNNSNAAGGDANSAIYNVTSTQFTVGSDNNKVGTYVAYLFAGGESSAATARSVDFDGTGDYLEIPNSSDFSFGSGNFTVEGWFKLNALGSAQSIIGVWDYSNNQRSWNVEVTSANKLVFSVSADGTNGQDALGATLLHKGVWTHFAAVRDGNTLKSFINGTQVTTSSFTGSLYDNTSDKLYIGMLNGSANITNAQLSNIRVVKGTAVYTSSFRPPTEPLTNITNTKLLCCNNSSTTGSTVTPGTITANGNPTASTDSPFDDPAGFVFGDAEESVIKCGSYVGNGSSDGPEIFLGWEPSYILLKNSDNSDEHWKVFDIMRGIVTGGNEPLLEPSTVNQDNSGNNALDLTPTGFKITLNGDFCNKDGDTIIYVAIRRPDGYVGKPAEAGTDVFNIGAGQNSEPGFIAGFPVDWAMGRDPDTGGAMYTGARLQGEYALGTHDNSAEFATTSRVFDYNNGWNVSRGANSPQISWMWKRHAGFDVVTVISAATGDRLPHSLGRTPEMIWGKNRDNGGAWSVYHKGLNGGTNPEQYRLILSDTDAEAANTGSWNDVAPTATHFTGGANWAGQNPIFMLFASVDGISKVGSFDGQNSDLTVTFGFQPRFLMVKRADSAGDWNVYDTTRGLVSGADKELRLNDTSTQSDHEVGDITSTGFTFACSSTHDTCQSGAKFIYYAHA